MAHSRKKTPRIYAVLAYDYYLDPRWSGLPDSAETLYTRALGYIKGQRTDGFIPSGALPHLKPLSKTLRRDAQALVMAGLWEGVDGGYVVHAWDRWNLTNAEQEELTAKRRKAADKRWKTNRGEDADADH